MDIAEWTLSDQHPGNHPDAAHPVIVYASEYPPEFFVPPHRHFRAQLVYAIDGVMRVVSGEGTWVVPPQQAVWVPPGVEHEVHSAGPVRMRSLYVHPGVATRLPRECCVLAVSALLRELIKRAREFTPERALSDAARRVVAVILDELEALEPAPLHLPVPQDPRLRDVTDALLSDPSDPRGLDEWGATVGASARTLARGFLRETGMSFGAWRTRLRLLRALTRLGEGDPVTRVAYDLGYGSPSAFVAMFKRELGAPPRRYLRPR